MGVVHDFANKLLNRHWQLFLSTDRLTQFRAEPEEGTPHTLAVFGLLQPSIFEGFASVSLMGACLDECLLFRYWTTIGVEFRQHPLIRPRYNTHQNGHLLTIPYATARDWSKRLRDLDVGCTGGQGQVRLLDTINCRVLDHMADRPFVWVGNNDVKDNPFGDAIRLPNVSHGLNAYANIDNAVILSALNPPPVYFEFVSQIAHINPTEVKTAIYRQAAYQAARRTGQYELACKILDFALKPPMKCNSDGVKMTHLINLAQAHKWAGRVDECLQT